eukprot:CAMPEP_0196139108 /NCGR_PEP_ID=MMETSP0910-20130528/6503_1 /TAXON_ID=49265 /ORGANISM="Thalassiosira rotula, Strain GSO102" /LENGTH=76 /DNA_ID=CAMNT_0041399793 /DNA_START=12 /DNA_END=238 /DNA_ORIENTATION=+
MTSCARFFPLGASMLNPQDSTSFQKGLMRRSKRSGPTSSWIFSMSLRYLTSVLGNTTPFTSPCDPSAALAVIMAEP